MENKEDYEKIKEKDYEEIKIEVSKIGLTESLFCKNLEENEDVFYYLLNTNYGGDLDNGLYAVLSYNTYEIYKGYNLKRNGGGYGLELAKKVEKQNFILKVKMDMSW